MSLGLNIHYYLLCFSDCFLRVFIIYFKIVVVGGGGGDGCGGCGVICLFIIKCLYMQYWSLYLKKKKNIFFF